ncbi:unnamed protein product [Penicillium nalgiovense]|nr:unnamed protein product [Penicillium nalgiovense]
MQWTILRPGMVDDTKEQYLQLISTSDIGFFAAAAFMNPEESKNHAFSLAGDELTFDQMSEIFKNLTGKDVPTTFRIPVWLMMAAVKDLGVMFKWFRDEGYGADIPALKKLNPSLKIFGDWLKEDSQFETR